MERQFVVVTVASNGVVHAWGDKDGQPFPNRSQAAYLVTKLKRSDKELVEFHPGVTVTYYTRKIMGDQPK